MLTVESMVHESLIMVPVAFQQRNKLTSGDLFYLDTVLYSKFFKSFFGAAYKSAVEYEFYYIPITYFQMNNRVYNKLHSPGRNESNCRFLLQFNTSSGSSRFFIY